MRLTYDQKNVSERDKNILELRNSGLTYKKIGEKHNLSSARVRSIFFKTQRIFSKNFGEDPIRDLFGTTIRNALFRGIRKTHPGIDFDLIDLEYVKQLISSGKIFDIREVGDVYIFKMCEALEIEPPKKINSIQYEITCIKHLESRGYKVIK